MAWAKQYKLASGKKQYRGEWRRGDGTIDGKAGFTTRKAALTYAVQQEHEAKNNPHHNPRKGKAVFRDVADEWLDSRRDLKDTTAAAYREALAPTTEATAKRHKALRDLRIDTVFGGYPVNAITREQISQWVGRMQKAGKSPSATRNAYFLVRQVLGHAVADGRIDANPADYVKLPTAHNTGTGGAVDDPSQFLDAEQVAALVDATPWPYNVLVNTAAWSGLRAGELAGLQVADLELPAARNRPGALRVERTVARIGRELHYVTPKTKGSRRRVPLPPDATELLRDYLAERKRRNEPTDPTAPLFPACGLSTPPPSTSAKKAAPAKARADRQALALAALTVEDAENRLELDWSSVLRHGTFYKAVFRPAVLRANADGADLSPALHFHGLRHIVSA